MALSSMGHEAPALSAGPPRGSRGRRYVKADAKDRAFFKNLKTFGTVFMSDLRNTEFDCPV